MEQSVQTLALLETAALALLTTVLIWWYRNAELTPTWISATVGVAWFLGFSGTLLLPLDVAQANTGLYSGSGAMLFLWQVVFWSTFILVRECSNRRARSVYTTPFRFDCSAPILGLVGSTSYLRSLVCRRTHLEGAGEGVTKGKRSILLFDGLFRRSLQWLPHVQRFVVA